MKSVTPDKRWALSAKPQKLPLLLRQEREGDGACMTVELKRPDWQVFLGASKTFERTYELDGYGLQVYDLCDGKRKVHAIVKIFARQNELDLAEAEIAVTRFLQTLTKKGLIAMVVRKR